MNMANKKNTFEEKAPEYFKASKKRKGEIIDSLVEVCGLTRKGVIKRFRRMQKEPPHKEEKRGRPRYFTSDVISALRDVWEIGAESCGENLHPQIGEYIETQLRSGAWTHGDEATAKLRAMSLGSVKAYVGTFERSRRSFGGRGMTKQSAVLSLVPIRMDGWDTAETGVTQIDTVAHCGETTAGDFVYTVNATDISTVWGTRRAQWQKGQEATVASIGKMRDDSPFRWTEMHPDSGTEFINHHLVRYAEETDLRVTRSRPYHKNDNQYVEERNGHVVRVYAGYARLDCREAVDALNELYDVLTPYLNHFIASRRIISKERTGARWKVSRETVAKTPYRRVLERGDVPEKVKEALRASHAGLDPKVMKAEIDRLKKRVFDVQKRYGKR